METDLQALKQEFICYLNNLSVEGYHMIPSVTSKESYQNLLMEELVKYCAVKNFPM